MVEDAIDNHPDAALARGRRERPEVIVAANKWLDLEVVSGVVAVVAWGVEDRVEIDIANVKYSFGGLAYEFYNSSELLDIYPR